LYSLSVGKNCSIDTLEIHACDEAVIEIGDGVGVVARTQIYMPEPSRLVIGYGCLFATDTLIRTSDHHAMLDIGTGERINPARDIEIGPEVWVGERAMILKGALIGQGSIIGCGSIVTGTIPANCAAAGNPARVIRTGVRWRHAL
jgi:acetyltransferase-like isoleucine patch superfamily enzyme